MEYEIYNDGEMYHWGIKGMRWGIRRYQNKDGSLTPAGKKRLRAETAKVRQEEQVLKNRKAVKAKLDRLDARRKAVEEGNKELDGEDVKTGRKGKKGSSSEADANIAVKKSVKDMTDEELAKAVNRARLEDQYRQLNPEPAPKKSGIKTMKEEVFVPAVKNSGKRFLENTMNKLGDKILEGKADPNSIEALKKTHEKLELQNKINKLKKAAQGKDDDLSIEDQTKKAKLRWDAEDRDSRSRGFKDRPDEDAYNRKVKAEADEAARKANEKISQEYYNRSNRSGAGSKYSTEYVNVGKTEVASASKNLPSTVSSLPAKTVKSGKSAVSGLLESSSATSIKNAKMTVEDKDGNVLAYWSGIRGDSDVII